MPRDQDLRDTWQDRYPHVHVEGEVERAAKAPWMPREWGRRWCEYVMECRIIALELDRVFGALPEHERQVGEISIGDHIDYLEASGEAPPSDRVLAELRRTIERGRGEKSDVDCASVAGSNGDL